MTQTQSIVGFVVTPEEIADRVRGLDNAIRALDAQITASKVVGVNAPYRAQWNAFMRRWAVQRDSFASWGARLFATRVMPIVDDFEKTYRWWATDFQRRTGVPVKGAPPVAQTGLVPSWVWLVGVVGIVLVIKSKI